VRATVAPTFTHTRSGGGALDRGSRFVASAMTDGRVARAGPARRAL
jgi:hypothetical protein